MDSGEAARARLASLAATILAGRLAAKPSNVNMRDEIETSVAAARCIDALCDNETPTWPERWKRPSERAA